ncbi:MAG: hypothetical protein WAU78_02630 [Roseiarcus sp.]
MPKSDESFFRDFQRAIDALNERPYRRYWRELGQFIHAFADAEQRLLSLLQKQTGVTDIVAGVLFSGTRSDAAKSLLAGILDATEQAEMKKRLERPLAQLAAIAKIRNHLIHWTARHDGGRDLLVSNAFLSPSAERLKEFRITVKAMKEMRLDLYRINVLILMEESPRSVRAPELDEYLAGPWLYKPPQPRLRERTPPPHPPKRSRQQHASRKSPQSR